MRRISLNARAMQEAEGTDEVPIVLFEFTHPDLEKPIRLSTDNTERLSNDPIYFGTRSTWRGANPITEPFLWVVASAELPSDEEDKPASASIVIENVDSELVTLLRSFVEAPTVCMAYCLASSPDLIEDEYTGLLLTSSSINAGEVSLSFSREEIELEYFPGGRMTRQRFPGLFL